MSPTAPRTLHHRTSCRLLTAFIALVLAGAGVRAQDVDEFDSPAQPARSSGGIFGAGGGVIPTWYMVHTDEINRQLIASGHITLPSGPLFMMGGHGHAYIMFIPNLRVGGMGAGGSFSSERVINGSHESVSWSTAFGGGTIEYVVPFGRFHLAGGILLGGGSRSFELTSGPDRTQQWTDLLIAGNSERLEFRNTFFAWQPMLTAEFEVSPFVVASVTGGWYGSSGSSWTLNDHFAVAGVPDFKSDGPFLRLGVTVGVFIGE